MITAIKDLVAASPVPVVFDHFGGAQAALGVEQPGFADLVELVKSGKAYVKISGAYRASKLGARLSDCDAVRPGADRGQSRPHRLGHRLAASGFGHAAGKQGDRRDAAAPDRRRQAAEPACRSGRRMRRSARRSWSTIRRGSTGSEARPRDRAALRPTERGASAQPVAGLAQATERKQVKSRDRRRCGRGRAAQSPDDLVRAGIRQQPAEPADLGAQCAHGIADTAAKRELCQRRRRGWTGETDDDRQIDTGMIDFCDPLQDRRALRSNRVTTFTRILVCRPQSRQLPSAFCASGSLRNGCPSG